MESRTTRKPPVDAKPPQKGRVILKTGSSIAQHKFNNIVSLKKRVR